MRRSARHPHPSPFAPSPPVGALAHRSVYTLSPCYAIERWTLLRRPRLGVGPPFPRLRMRGLRFRFPLRTRPCVLLLCMPPFRPSPSFLGFIVALGSTSLFGFLLVPSPIGVGSVVARCPFRAPAPGVLPGAPSRTRLKALPFGGRGVGAYAPVFFIGLRTHLRAAFSMVSP